MNGSNKSRRHSEEPKATKNLVRSFPLDSAQGQNVTRVKGLVILGMLMATLFFPLVPARAAEKLCECFCTSEKGAQKKGGYTQLKCSEVCAELNERVVACVFSASQYPATNLSCFTSDQCKQHCEGMTARK